MTQKFQVSAAKVRIFAPVVAFAILLCVLVGLIAANLGPGKETPSVKNAANPVVIVGFTGVSWPDISATATPNIWQFLANANVGAMLVRTSLLPIDAADGWASLGAGDTAVGYTAPNTLNALSLAAISGGLKSRTYGPLAPYALTARDHVADLPSSPGQLQTSIVNDLSQHTQLIIVDAGRLDTATSLARGGNPNAAPQPGYSSLREIDAYVGQVIQAAHVAAPQALVVAASVADDGQPPEPRFLASQTAINQPPGLLNSVMTRQAGMARVSDILPTAMNHLKVTLPASYRPGRFDTTPMPFQDATQIVTDRTLAANAIESAAQRNKFFGVIGTLFVVCLVPTFIASQTNRRGWAFGAGFALSLPVATFVAMLVPWYRFSTPLLALCAATCAIAAVFAFFAVKVGRTGFGIAGVAGLITAVVIYADAVLGSTLQMSAPLGEQVTQGARWYGMGNLRHGLALSGAVTFVGWQLSRIPGRNKFAQIRRTALVVACGLPCIIIDVAPMWGSDLGGLFGSVPAFISLLFMATNLKFSLRRMAVVLGGMMLAVVMICILDWLRPPESRTHLGDLIDSVISGEIFALLGSVLEINARMLFTGANWLLPLIFVACGVWVIRNWRRHRVFDYEPALRGTLLAMLVGGTLAFISNDSGTSLISAVIALMVPAALLVMQSEREGEQKFADSRIEKLRSDL